MNDESSPQGGRIQVGDSVELTKYIGGDWRRLGGVFLPPGLQGKIVGTRQDPEGRDVLLVRHEQGPPTPVYPEEIKKIPSPTLYETRPDDPPLEKKIEFIKSLSERRDLTEGETAALVGAERFRELTGGEGGTAQALIERLLAYPHPSTLKSLRIYARRLDLDEHEAAALVNAADFSELTGGRDGTARELVTLLREKDRSRRGSRYDLDSECESPRRRQPPKPGLLDLFKQLWSRIR